MSSADELDPFASLAEWLAWEVRRRRTAAGMLQEELARHLSVSFQQMCHLESLRRNFRIEHVRVLDSLWDANGHFERLWVHAQREHDRDWFRKFTGYERRAKVIKIFQPLIVPGLFQTPDYARALLYAARIPEIEPLVEARMARQEILTRDDPPLVWALIAEGALREPVGGHAVMGEQLDRLLKIADLPNVTVQIIPIGAGAHVGLDGGFILLDLGEDGELAFIEAQLTGRLVRDETEVRDLAIRYDRIRAKALSEGDSLTLIASIRESMK